jgi:hypothetical protein
MSRARDLASGTFDNPIKVDTIQNTSGTTGLTIDSTGRVSQSVVPSWRLSLTADQSFTVAAENTIEFDKSSGDNCYLDGGCTLSSGAVTVPVAGLYIITNSMRFDSVGSGYAICRIRINNNTAGKSETYVIDGGPNANYDNLNMSEVFKLSAGDDVRITAGVSADTSWHIDQNSTFSGALIG